MSKYKWRVNQRLRKDKRVRRLADDELDRVHRIYLRMTKNIIDTCRDNGIYMTLGGGSVLGAVRHGGFIPWDDDVDLHISREGMEKLKAHFEDYFQGKYNFHAPNYDPENKTRMGKIETNEVRIIDYNGKKHGLEIDLFVIENVPDQPLLYRLFGLRSLIYTAISGMVIDYENARDDPEGSGENITWEQSIRRFLGRILSLRPTGSWLNKLDKVNQYPRSDTIRVGIPTGQNHYFGETFLRSEIMEDILLNFEGYQFPVPRGYDAYLKKIYGQSDYMTIPSEEQRGYHYIRSVRFAGEQEKDT